ncbi:MAG: glycyl-radical enzyme activating protein [Firmicutes bacterium]|nr:glycyl-radical enzyme activating protein [Candidatus Fermentithermobacillaceae bacterium]
MQKGTIFNIQKFSVHDGPGIRTTVFFKGCPLRCKWCHNPEGQSMTRELVVYDSRCVRCGSCLKVCPQNAIRFIDLDSGVRIQEDLLVLGRKDTAVVTDREKCTVCGECVFSCPSGAREIAGKEVSSDYVLEEVIKDRIFYEQSGGGVTFSGGEPLMQPAFLKELCVMSKHEGISVAVDTSGYAPWNQIESIIPFVDTFLYDIKTMDPQKHLEYTGVSNSLILENLKKLSEVNANIIGRIPIVPGMNDDRQSVEDIGEYLSGLNVKKANILPYHNIGIDKYERLGKTYELSDVPEPKDEDMLRVKAYLEHFGLNVEIGG